MEKSTRLGKGERAYRYIDAETYKLLLEMIKPLDIPQLTQS
ncbi:hypothetical protein [Coxiella-like endosymbiont]|nr:hypothetical protein [Coxiella-like endosymbiont]